MEAVALVTVTLFLFVVLQLLSTICLHTCLYVQTEYSALSTQSIRTVGVIWIHRGSSVQELLDYWCHSYDWPKQQQLLNSMQHFKLQVDDISLHYIHQPSKDPNAIPLLLVHGWPGSFFEYYKVILKLKEGMQPPTAQAISHRDLAHESPFNS